MVVAVLPPFKARCSGNTFRQPSCGPLCGMCGVVWRGVCVCVRVCARVCVHVCAALLLLLQLLVVLLVLVRPLLT